MTELPAEIEAKSDRMAALRTAEAASPGMLECSDSPECRELMKLQEELTEAFVPLMRRLVSARLIAVGVLLNQTESPTYDGVGGDADNVGVNGNIQLTASGTDTLTPRNKQAAQHASVN